MFEQLSKDSTAPDQQPGFSRREVSLRRQESCQSAQRGSIAQPVSAPPDALSDIIVTTSPLPSCGEAVQAAEAEGGTSDAANHAPYNSASDV